MTTEEMNIKIAEYMGFVGHIENGVELDYDMDWNWIMEVWQKLRGELTQTKEMYKLRYNIENAIITCDITTAHRLIVEAITLIKK